MKFTDAELSLICIHIGKLIDEKVIEREIPEDLIHELVDTVILYQDKQLGLKTPKKLFVLGHEYKLVKENVTNE